MASPEGGEFPDDGFDPSWIYLREDGLQFCVRGLWREWDANGSGSPLGSGAGKNVAVRGKGGNGLTAP